jgi:hypothetical protein
MFNIAEVMPNCKSKALSWCLASEESLRRHLIACFPVQVHQSMQNRMTETRMHSGVMDLQY